MTARRSRRARFRRSATRAASSPEPIRITASDGNASHYVTDVEMGVLAQGESPHALCGQQVVPAALTVPPGPLCALCAAIEHQSPTAP